ncbi:MAG: hypothetical protein L3J75_12620 [Methylococcaceae bacterium]|nr:hypothetical protein [Methylococcaceae bacterium]
MEIATKMTLYMNRFLLIVATLALLSACQNPDKRPLQIVQKNISNPEYQDTAALEDKWGVHVVAIRTTAAGHMLDFRFKVLDVEKAKPLLSRAVKPYLIVEKNNERNGVPVTPKLGALRNKGKTPKKDKIYFIFFGNPLKSVQTGDLVTVVIGDFKVEHLKVQ